LGILLSDQTSETIVEAFVDRFICILGASKAINKLREEFYFSKKKKDSKFRTTVFHPQSNGFLKQSHHILGEYLKQTQMSRNNGTDGST